MRFGSVCSGIEAASVAWEPLGWRAAWVAEIEPFPAAVLAARWPAVPNLGDLRRLPSRVSAAEVEAPEVLCGGTPCQAFSVAGALAAEPGMKQQTYVAQASSMQVRRLTPRECERLQGFPDDYTAIPWRGRAAAECPDGPRYRALGNSWAVPVVRWIGRRIANAVRVTEILGVP